MMNTDGSWLIDPYAGLGPIRIGMLHDDVHSALAEDPVGFSRSTEESSDEEYRGVGIFVYYGEDGCVSAIESYAVDGDSKPSLDAILLNGRSVELVLAELARMDIKHDSEMSDGASFVFSGRGFTLYSNGESVESVTVFRHGYYDD